MSWRIGIVGVPLGAQRGGVGAGAGAPAGVERGDARRRASRTRANRSPPRPHRWGAVTAIAALAAIAASTALPPRAKTPIAACVASWSAVAATAPQTARGRELGRAAPHDASATTYAGASADRVSCPVLTGTARAVRRSVRRRSAGRRGGRDGGGAAVIVAARCCRGSAPAALRATATTCSRSSTASGSRRTGRRPRRCAGGRSCPLLAVVGAWSGRGGAGPYAGGGRSASSPRVYAGGDRPWPSPTAPDVGAVSRSGRPGGDGDRRRRAARRARSPAVVVGARRDAGVTDPLAALARARRLQHRRPSVMIPSTPRSSRRLHLGRRRRSSRRGPRCRAGGRGRTNAGVTTVTPLRRTGTWAASAAPRAIPARASRPPARPARRSCTARARSAGAAGARRRSLNAPTHTRSRHAERARARRPAGSTTRVGLAVDVDPGLGERVEQLVEQRDRLAAVDPGRRDLAPRQLVDASRPAARPRQVVVVERDDDAVGRHVDVGLEVAVAEVDGAAGTPASCSRAPRWRRRGGRTRSGPASRGTGAGAATGAPRTAVWSTHGHRRMPCIRCRSPASGSPAPSRPPSRRRTTAPRSAGCRCAGPPTSTARCARPRRRSPPARCRGGSAPRSSTPRPACSPSAATSSPRSSPARPPSR